MIPAQNNFAVKYLHDDRVIASPTIKPWLDRLYNNISYMKIIIALLCLFVAVRSFDLSAFEPVPNDLEECIAERCPTEFQKCKATSGCEDKLKKCEAKCGAKVDYTCWSFCIGLPGAAANVCNCAVKQGCLNNSIFKMIQEFFQMVNKA